LPIELVVALKDEVGFCFAVDAVSCAPAANLLEAGQIVTLADNGDGVGAVPNEAWRRGTDLELAPARIVEQQCYSHRQQKND
jgi:hypothetical protein